MIIIKYKKISNELIYSIDVVFKRFLDIEYRFEKNKYNNIEIINTNSDVTLSINADFFKRIDDSWLNKKSLPELPLEKWSPKNNNINANLLYSSIPVIYGGSGFEKRNNKLWHLKLDIFGSIFFMLSRYEEMVKPDRDKYDRFPASSSIAYNEGFLERPIVNEYLEILWSCMKQLWPDLGRKKYTFKMKVSCDLDYPYQCGIKRPIKQLKCILGDLVIRKSLIRAVNSSINYFTSKSENYSFDFNYKSIDWIMDVNENKGNVVTFYFIAEHSDKTMDGCYSLDEPIVRKIMRNIYERGHEIGLHPSFHSYQDVKQLSKERRTLQRVMLEEGIEQERLGSRQHYLRWQSSVTAKNLEAAGLDYDSTLSFADQVGFRSGVCYEYPLYDLVDRKTLNLIEKPLIFMDGTLLESNYNGISNEIEFNERVESLVNAVKHFNGEFVFLWHNYYFDKKWYKNSYQKILLM